MPRPRLPLVGRALDTASASIGLAQRTLRVAGEVVDELRENAGDVARTAGTGALHALDAADVGIGDARLTREGAEWARLQLARGLRQVLALPDDASDRLRSADPATMARAVLALLGGEEELLPLPSVEEQVRARFRALLDPTTRDDGATPALLTITGQLSPDEARVLRHLDSVGAVPVIDVQSTSLVGRNAVVVAEHLSMVVERSGGDHPERGPQYLANLTRLGLCRIDERELPEHPDYELITTGEAYRSVAEEVREERAGRPRVRRRSLRLSALGEQLVEVAFHAEVPPTARLEGPPPPPAAALSNPRRRRP